MTPERYQRVGQLYREALRLVPEQRPDFLSKACGGEETLRREVESLLGHEAHGDGLLDAPALEVVARALAVEQSQSWVGRQVSHYQILSLLGRGGMGEVYRARDIRLGREVAIKSLPVAYSVDATRLRRFEQEARTAGRLNHPNVLTVHDIGLHDGAPFIVAELLEGEELRQQLNRGAIPPRRAIDYAKQIANGLAAAHAKGIVHRDLKPENLFATTDGRVKILDFGLAKLMAHPSAGGVDPMSSDQPLGTVPGLVMGTIGYMSPEQVRGQEADHRTDIFAFGVILHEMLSGRRPFEGASAVEVMTAILKGEPPDLSEAGRSIAPVLGKIVRRCLEKNPEQRFQSVSDLGFALEALSSTSAASIRTDTSTTTLRTGAVRLGNWFGRALWILVSVLSAVAAGIVVWNVRPAIPVAPQPVARFVVPLGGEQPSGNVRLSPDGAYLAYTLGRPGALRLHLRDLAAVDTKPIAEFEGGNGPFFSPDSQWLGFFANGKLKKVSVHGGPPITLADAPSNRGASWAEDGWIVFTPNGRSGLFRVSANGGPSEILTTPDSERMETSHNNPQSLPGGKAVVYVARGETQANSAVLVFSFENRQSRVLIAGGPHLYPRYAPTGHLVYLRLGSLMAAQFDLDRFELTGTPVPVVEDVATYDFSNTGSLVYAPRIPSDASPAATLVWVNRQGVPEPLRAPPKNYLRPRLSPNGRRIVLEITSGVDSNLWIYDLVRDVLTRLTFDGRNLWSVWTQDGRRVIYGSNRIGTTWDVYWKAADGTGTEEALLTKPHLQIPHALSGDGRVLALTEVSPASIDTWLLSMSDRTTSGPFVNGLSPTLSPDGQWVAYASNESGRYEVYVRPTSGAAGKWMISTDGGVEPLWAPGGTELFYRDGGRMLAVDVMTRAGFEHGKPYVLFEGPYTLDGLDSHNYDVTSDGQRFLMIKEQTESVTRPLNVVLNWFEDLKRVVTTQK